MVASPNFPHQYGRELYSVKVENIAENGESQGQDLHLSSVSLSSVTRREIVDLFSNLIGIYAAYVPLNKSGH